MRAEAVSGSTSAGGRDAEQLLDRGGGVPECRERGGQGGAHGAVDGGDGRLRRGQVDDVVGDAAGQRDVVQGQGEGGAVGRVEADPDPDPADARGCR